MPRYLAYNMRLPYIPGYPTYKIRPPMARLPYGQRYSTCKIALHTRLSYVVGYLTYRIDLHIQRASYIGDYPTHKVTGSGYITHMDVLLTKVGEPCKVKEYLNKGLEGQ